PAERCRRFRLPSGLLVVVVEHKHPPARNGGPDEGIQRGPGTRKPLEHPGAGDDVELRPKLQVVDVAGAKRETRVSPVPPVRLVDQTGIDVHPDYPSSRDRSFENARGDRPVPAAGVEDCLARLCGVGRPPSPCTGNGPTALRPARTRARRPAEVVGINHAANPSEVATAFRTRSIGASIRIIRWIAGSISTLFSTVCPSSNSGLTASPAHV